MKILNSRPPTGPSGRGASENIAILNICFDFFVVKAPSGDKCSKSKKTLCVHFISFKVKNYVISWLLIKNLNIAKSYINS